VFILLCGIGAWLYRFQVKIRKESLDWQKPGILVLGIGIGLFIVGILDNYMNTDLPDSLAVAILIISAGVAMIIANRLDKKRDI
jgi:hypothetical protein